MTRIVKPQVATTPAAASTLPATAAVAKAAGPAGQKSAADSFERVDASPAPGALGGTSTVGGGSPSPVGPGADSPQATFGHLADRLVLMTDGPAATVGRIMDVPFERPRSRSTVLKDPMYHACRREVIEFLDVHARQRVGA